MSINPISGSSGTSVTSKADGQTLGKDDFLRLLVSQLQHQDPLNPMDQKDFMGQMAQFSSLEQLTNLAAEVKQMGFAGQVSQSVGLLGKTVGYERADGSRAEGAATAVEIAGGRILVTVGGEQISPASITSVA
jgi:flagellar basal-body rod modification protein FlgD